MYSRNHHRRDDYTKFHLETTLNHIEHKPHRHSPGKRRDIKIRTHSSHPLGHHFHRRIFPPLASIRPRKLDSTCCRSYQASIQMNRIQSKYLLCILRKIRRNCSCNYSIHHMVSNCRHHIPPAPRSISDLHTLANTFPSPKSTLARKSGKILFGILYRPAHINNRIHNIHRKVHRSHHRRFPLPGLGHHRKQGSISNQASMTSLECCIHSNIFKCRRCKLFSSP